jgi:YYY domain-containing protein
MGRRGWLELVLTGIVLGSLYAINSWDFPTYLLMYLGALLLLHIRLARPPARREAAYPTPSPASVGIVHQFSRASLRQIWWGYYLRQAVLVLAAALLLLVPFHLTFKSLVARLDPLIDLPILASITRTLGVVTQSHTTISNFLVIFGLFLLPTVAYVFAQGRAKTRDTAHSFGADRSLRWIILAALLLGPLIGFPMLVLLPLAIYAAQLAAEHVERPAASFALWAFAVGCLICFGTDVVYIRDVFEGLSARLNTIFKFYYQAWLIWGVLAGYAVWWLVMRRTTDDGRQTTDQSRLSSIVYRLSSILLTLVFVLLLAGALVYPWLTAGRSLREKPIVGLAGITPRQATPEGAASIDWLRANVPGNAVILEAVGGAYNGEGFGGVSASTGLATVIGWPGHEDQWRGGDPGARAQIGPRQADVTTIYTTTSVETARALLQQYKVGYVYVGGLERATFPPEGLDKFAQLGEPVFQQGDVTIYRVNQ